MRKKIFLGTMLLMLCVLLTSCKKTYYKVDFYSDGSVFETQEVIEKGNAVEPEKEPDKEGYDFIGWFLGEEKYTFGSVTSNVRLDAKFEIKTFTVSFNVNGVITTTKVEYGKKVDVPREPVMDNNEFVRWVVNNETYDFNSEVKSDLVLVAEFKLMITGTGVESDPYKVSTVKGLSKALESGGPVYIELTADLDFMGEEFLVDDFEGVLDGKGFEFKNLGGPYFFRNVNNSVIKNLKVSGSLVSEEEIAGFILYAENTTIYFCEFDLEVEGDMAAIVAVETISVDVLDSIVKGTVSGNITGGVFCNMSGDSSISGCYVTALVEDGGVFANIKAFDSVIYNSYTRSEVLVVDIRENPLEDNPYIINVVNEIEEFKKLVNGKYWDFTGDAKLTFVPAEDITVQINLEDKVIPYGTKLGEIVDLIEVENLFLETIKIGSVEVGMNVSLNNSAEIYTSYVNFTPFMRKWVNASGEIDLSKNIQEFKKANYIGDEVQFVFELGETYYYYHFTDGVISYSTSVNKESVVYYPEPEYFLGLWEHPYGYVYYITKDFDEDYGEFIYYYDYTDLSWNATYTTKLIVSEDGNKGEVIGYVYGDIFQVEDDALSYYWGSYGDTAWTDVLSSFSDYFYGNWIDEDGNVFSYSEDGATYNDTAVEIALSTSLKYGSGVKFDYNSVTYYVGIDYMGDTFITSDIDSLEYMYYFDFSEFVGAWSNSDGSKKLVVNENETITYNGNNCEYSIGAEDGSAVYFVNVNGVEHKFSYVNGVTFLETTNGTSEYFFLDEAKEFFVGKFTNGLFNLEIKSDYSVLVDSVECGKGLFDYESNFGVIAFIYSDGTDEHILLIADYNYGIYYDFDASTGEYGFSYFDESKLELNFGLFYYEKGDILVSGGADPITVEVDMENYLITYNGIQTVFMLEDLDSYGPVMFFVLSDGEEGYISYFIYCLDYTAYLTYPGEVDEDGNYVYDTLVLKSRLDEVYGKTYVYRGEYYDEAISVFEDGKLSITTTNPDATSDEVIIDIEYSYSVSDYIGFDGETRYLALIANLGTFNLYVNFQENSASIFDIPYLKVEMVDFVGKYGTENGEIVELAPNGNLIIDGVTISEKVVQFSELGFTYTFTHVFPDVLPPNTTGLTGSYNYIVGFYNFENKIIAHVTRNMEEKIYEKVDVDLFDLIGVYKGEEDTIEIKGSRAAINSLNNITLYLGGMEISSFKYETFDSQIGISFSALSFPTFETINYVVKIVVEEQSKYVVVTKDGNEIVRKLVSDFDFKTLIGTYEVTDNAGKDRVVKVVSKMNNTAIALYVDDFTLGSFNISVNSDGYFVVTGVYMDNTVSFILGESVICSVTVPVLPPMPPAPPIL